MSVSTVTTQAELDAAIAAGGDCIDIRSPHGVWLDLPSSGSATVRAYGSATVQAYDSATVQAYGSATVQASGSATVQAYGSATVQAYGGVAIHLHSARATITGNGITIDHTLERLDPATWCEYHGVTVTDGIATVHKAVNDQWTTDRGTNYAPGSMPTCDDWADNNRCGGGLHFSPWPWEAATYQPGATRYVAVGINLADLRPIPGGTPKCKAPAVIVACREVDIDGREVTR